MSKELMIPNDLTPEIFTDSGIELLIKEVEAKAATFVGDISTESGRKDVSSFAYKISRSKTAVDDMGKAYVAELKEEPKKVDAQRKLFRDSMDAIRDKVRQPLTEWEDAEKLRVEGLETHILMLITLGDQSRDDWQTLPIKSHQEALEILKKDSELDWQEFAERAAQVITESIEKVEIAINKRNFHDNEQAELEQLRNERLARQKSDYEQKLKDEAVKAAAVEAEQAAQKEKDRVANEIKLAEIAREQAVVELEAAKLKAVDDAKRAEAAKVEAAKQAEADKEASLVRERERVAAEDKAKAATQARLEANKKHTSKINKEIAETLEELCLKFTSSEIVEKIAAGYIPHVSIIY